jgi:hypothetical protein
LKILIDHLRLYIWLHRHFLIIWNYFEAEITITMNTNRLYKYLISVVLFYSCQNEDTKAPDLPKDSTSVSPKGGAGSGNDSTGLAGGGTSKTSSPTKDTSSSTIPVVKKMDEAKNKKQSKAAKKMGASRDSASVDNDADLPVIKKTKPVSADLSKTTVGDNAVSAKPFVSKYGTIPRNATQDNITEFLIAFTDKTTFIKIYYNADADNEMQGVRAQIVKVLKKSGYNSISDQTLTLHPIHVPKDIHYELQHDGSVVIWIPPVTVE